MVRAYYEQLEAGRTTEAARLRADGRVEDLASLDTMQAEVGTPGPVEVTLQRAYIQTPVVVHGRLSAGGEYRRSGKVLLSRANWAPWTPGGQPLWRIERISLTP